MSASPEELEADALDDARRDSGCQQIGGLHDRDVVRIYGHVRSVALAPMAGTPSLEATLFDGSGLVTLVWLGQRTIAGVKPGADLVASGRVSCHDGRRLIYNPRYELRV